MVFEMLRDMIVELVGCGEDEMTLSSELRDDLGLTDSQLEEILDAMAGELGFRREDLESEELSTAGQLVRAIAGLL